MATYPPCSKLPFFQRSSMRVIEHDQDVDFMSFPNVPVAARRENDVLNDLLTTQTHWYLALNMGEPGFARGVRDWITSGLVFSPSFKRATTLCSARIQGNKIRFGWGNETETHERSQCWEIATRRHRVIVRETLTTLPPKVFPFSLTREGQTSCPVCYEDLSGNVVGCINRHQTCLTCFNMLPLRQGVKVCPMCNEPGKYCEAELNKVKEMNGATQKTTWSFHVDEDGGNSFRMYQNNEGLMLGMIRYASSTFHWETFSAQLMSAFFNFYTTHCDGFTSYNFNFTSGAGINARVLTTDDVDEYTGAFSEFLDVIESSEILEDVEKTHVSVYHYHDTDFYAHLRAIYGDLEKIGDYPGDEKKSMLKRRVLFMTRVREWGRGGLFRLFMETLVKMAERVKSYDKVFRHELVREAIVT
jgi:hypothetical protein